MWTLSSSSIKPVALAQQHIRIQDACCRLCFLRVKANINLHNTSPPTMQGGLSVSYLFVQLLKSHRIYRPVYWIYLLIDLTLFISFH